MTKLYNILQIELIIVDDVLDYDTEIVSTTIAQNTTNSHQTEICGFGYQLIKNVNGHRQYILNIDIDTIWKYNVKYHQIIWDIIHKVVRKYKLEKLENV